MKSERYIQKLCSKSNYFKVQILKPNIISRNKKSIDTKFVV